MALRGPMWAHNDFRDERSEAGKSSQSVMLPMYHKIQAGKRVLIHYSSFDPYPFRNESLFTVQGLTPFSLVTPLFLDVV